MNRSNINDIAIEFIKEILSQISFKEQNPGKRPIAVGLRTERKFREVLNEYFFSTGLTFRDEKMNQELILKAQDFFKAGLNRTKSFESSFGQLWRQCDLYGEKNNKVLILGEVKTTTSAPHNLCGLINKNLSSIRIFGSFPLSVVLYPDIKPKTLVRNHINFIAMLLDAKLISEDEFNVMRESLFVLTTIGWRGGLEKRTRAITHVPAGQLNQIINEERLLRDEDIDTAEFERLEQYLRKVGEIS